MCSYMAVWHADMLAKQCYIGIEVRILVLKHCKSVMCALAGLLRQVYTIRYSSDCGIPTIPIFGAFLLYLVPHLSTYSETLLQFSAYKYILHSRSIAGLSIQDAINGSKIPSEIDPIRIRICIPWEGFRNIKRTCSCRRNLAS